MYNFLNLLQWIIDILGLLWKIMKQNYTINHFQRVKLLKQTNYKHIYEIYNFATNQTCIQKIQKTSIHQNLIDKQITCLSLMQGYPGIPKLIWYQSIQNDKKCLIMNKLGQTLGERLRKCGGKFSIKTSCMLALDIINILQSLRLKQIIYEKIGLQSLQFGTGKKCNQLFLNDFSNCQHVYCQQQHKISVCYMFAPKRAYLSQSKPQLQDDLQSLFYLIVYMLKGQLPWSHIYSDRFFNQTQKLVKQPNQKIKFSQINKNNRFDSIEILCKNLPKCMKDIIKNIRCQKQTQISKLHFFKIKIKYLLYSLNQEHDEVYDWTLNYKFIHNQKQIYPLQSISLDTDQQYLNNLFQNYGKNIDIDEINTKYLKMKRKIQQQHSRKAALEESVTISINRTSKHKNREQQYNQKGQKCMIM